MAAISPVEPAGAPYQPAPQPRDQKGARAAVEFGAAVTHHDMVQEKLRVDPAALAARQRSAAEIRPDDESRRDRLRDERLARQEAGYQERKAQRGVLVDIEA